MSSAPNWSTWTPDPTFLVALLAATVLYAGAYRRAQRAPGPDPGAGHWMPYAAGVIALAAALISPLDAIGDRWLLSAHVLQHILLADVAPALLILGLRAPVIPLGLSPQSLRLVAHRGRFGAVFGILTRPSVALPAWALATLGWSLPAVFDAAATHPLLHAVEHATLFYTGIALWWLIIDPLPSDRRQPHGVRLAYLGFTRAVSALVCVPLTWASSTFYPLYAHAPRAYGISPLADQQLAGAGMCFLEFLVFGLAVATVFIDALARSERAQSAREARAWAQ